MSKSDDPEMQKLVNSPYGQFVSTLWRGSESREMLETHVEAHYEELDACVRNGIKVNISGTEEEFNLVCFFVADLCFIKDIIGKWKFYSL